MSLKIKSLCMQFPSTPRWPAAGLQASEGPLNSSLQILLFRFIQPNKSHFMCSRLGYHVQWSRIDNTAFWSFCPNCQVCEFLAHEPHETDSLCSKQTCNESCLWLWQATLVSGLWSQKTDPLLRQTSLSVNISICQTPSPPFGRWRHIWLKITDCPLTLYI